MKRDIDILVSTFNGEEYLEALLDSIRNQTSQSWRILLRDNCSTDGTVEIVESRIRTFPDRMALINDTFGNIGPCQSFARLLEYSDAGYIMFCDCDDVWVPEKVELTLKKMQEMESRYGSETPLLVHSDLRVVDSDLNVLAESFWRYQNLRPKKGTALNRLLVQNVITGCTVMINRPLRDLSIPIPPEAIMHDWWLGLVAAAFGKIASLSHPTILYRQHGGNATGAKRYFHYVVKQTASFFKAHTLKGKIRKTLGQARAFLDRYRDRLSGTDLAMVRAYASLGERGFLGKRGDLLRYGFFKRGVIPNIGLFILV